MRKEINRLNKNTRVINSSTTLNLELEISAGSFTRVLTYKINPSEQSSNKELPPAPPNSCILDSSIPAAFEAGLVSNDTSSCASPGARFQNLAISYSDGDSNPLSGVVVQGSVNSEVSIKVNKLEKQNLGQLFIQGPGLNKTNLLDVSEVTHTISQDGRDLLIIEAGHSSYLRGDINADESVDIYDIMKIVNHIMEEPLSGDEYDRAQYVNLQIPSKSNQPQEVDIVTLMAIVDIVMAQN